MSRARKLNTHTHTQVITLSRQQLSPAASFSREQVDLPGKEEKGEWDSANGSFIAAAGETEFRTWERERERVVRFAERRNFELSRALFFRLSAE